MFVNPQKPIHRHRNGIRNHWKDGHKRQNFSTPYSLENDLKTASCSLRAVVLSLRPLNWRSFAELEHERNRGGNRCSVDPKAQFRFLQQECRRRSVGNENSWLGSVPPSCWSLVSLVAVRCIQGLDALAAVAGTTRSSTYAIDRFHSRHGIAASIIFATNATWLISVLVFELATKT